MPGKAPCAVRGLVGLGAIDVARRHTLFRRILYKHAAPVAENFAHTVGTAKGLWVPLPTTWLLPALAASLRMSMSYTAPMRTHSGEPGRGNRGM